MTRVYQAMIFFMTFALATISFATVPNQRSLFLTEHPNHHSFAEIEYNKKTGNLEVSLALLAIDLEETLSRRAGLRINLDSTGGIQQILESYLFERFTITRPDGTKPRPNFLGREDMGKTVWLYFTLPLVVKKKALKSKIPKPSMAYFPHAPMEPTMPVRLTIDPVLTTNPASSPLLGTRLANRVLMELHEEQDNKVTIREGKWRRNMLYRKHTQNQILRRKISVASQAIKKRTSPAKSLSNPTKSVSTGAPVKAK